MDQGVPSLVVLRLSGTEYDEEAHVTGIDAYETRDPFPVRVVPHELDV